MVGEATRGLFFAEPLDDLAGPTATQLTPAVMEFIIQCGPISGTRKTLNRRFSGWKTRQLDGQSTWWAEPSRSNSGTDIQGRAEDKTRL